MSTIEGAATGHEVDGGRPCESLAGLFDALSPAACEVAARLLPEWRGTMTELLRAAILLTDRP